MTAGGISKLDAAQRQLNCAIRLLFSGDDSLAIHTLAYASYKVLFDLCDEHDRTKIAVHITVEAIGLKNFKYVPEFLKHARDDPNEILDVHSAKSTYLTLWLAMMLYRANGGIETPEMRSLFRADDPFEEGHRSKEILGFFRESRNDPRLWQFTSGEGHALSAEDRATLQADLGRRLAAPST